MNPVKMSDKEVTTMARYYGIRLCSANVLLNNQAKDYAVSGNDIMWFSTEDAAVRFCDDFFKYQQEMRQAMPELYEQEKTSMPGVAYMWMTDTLTQLTGMPGNPTGYLGSGEAPAQEAGQPQNGPDPFGGAYEECAHTGMEIAEKVPDPDFPGRNLLFCGKANACFCSSCGILLKSFGRYYIMKPSK